MRSSRWSRVTISRDKQSHSESNDPERTLFRFGSTVNDPNIVACDIVELLCDASNEERPTCPRISSSTELEEQANGVCFTCKDCAECQLQQQQQQNCAAAKTHKTKEEEDQDEELKHLDYYEADVVDGETDSTIASVEHEKAPILVDLTSEESRKTIWKQTILKRFGDTEESSEVSGENVIMSKSDVLSDAINTPPSPSPYRRQSLLILMCNIFSRIDMMHVMCILYVESNSRIKRAIS